MTAQFREHLVLFGGSFNPPHLGHVAAAKGLMQNPGVKKVFILPSYGNPLKPEITAYEHRLLMAKLNFTGFDVSQFEHEQKSRSTDELLTKIRLLTHDQPVAFAIGADQLETLDAWVNFPSFLSRCDWIVLLRKPKHLNDCGPVLKKYEAMGILKATRDPTVFEIGTGGKEARILKIVETEAIDISSTWIREQFALGKKDAVKKFLKPDVLEYIERNSLYGT